MESINNQIAKCIEDSFNINGKNMSENIIVFPLGDIGTQVVNILKNVYFLDPAYLIDNHKCNYNSKIRNSLFLSGINADNYVVILASTNPDIYLSLRKMILDYFPRENLIELECMKRKMAEEPMCLLKTKIGRYSTGPICRDSLHIESIGAFCSFAEGVDVVANHETRYLSTHNMIWGYSNFCGLNIDYHSYKERLGLGYFPGINPKLVDAKKKWGRCVIGNDVWLGKNVLICNYSNIGNGVIAGAGAVITKDVPDYAVVGGVPARIIKYRYSPKQIKALNKIAWWDWPDDEIRERYDDFYLPIDEFINKYIF